MPYEQGDMVLKLHKAIKEGECHKLAAKFTGPPVVSKTWPGDTHHYEVCTQKRTMVVHHDLLKPFFSEPPRWVVILRQRFRQGLSREVNFDEVFDLAPFWESISEQANSSEIIYELDSGDGPRENSEPNCRNRRLPPHLKDYTLE